MAAEGSGDMQSSQRAVRISRAITRTVQSSKLLTHEEKKEIPELIDDDSDDDSNTASPNKSEWND